MECCIHCGNEMTEQDIKEWQKSRCCNGHECGCMGYPTDPPECLTCIVDYLKKNYDNLQADKKQLRSENERLKSRGIEDMQHRIKELEEALRPFAHPDLCKILAGNVLGEDSPVFGREKAILLIKDFIRAKEALEEGDK